MVSFDPAVEPASNVSLGCLEVGSNVAGDWNLSRESLQDDCYRFHLEGPDNQLAIIGMRLYSYGNMELTGRVYTSLGRLSPRLTPDALVANIDIIRTIGELPDAVTVALEDRLSEHASTLLEARAIYLITDTWAIETFADRIRASAPEDRWRSFEIRGLETPQECVYRSLWN